jgi:three-Cys-motif partner protein
LLKGYLSRYVEVLCSNPARDHLKLTLVDGFAGGGRYLDSSGNECPGSPLIMLEAMRAAELAAQSSRRKPFKLDVEYVFIEENPAAREYLQNVIDSSMYAKEVRGKTHIVAGSFIEHCDRTIEFVKRRGPSARVIFLLDQFGYSDVPLIWIRSIFDKLCGAEIILTFAVGWLIDYLNSGEGSQRILERLGVELLPEAIAEAKQHAEWRQMIQLLLHDEIPAKTATKFYTPFFLRSTDAHRDLWLLHLSSHARARDVMVAEHWSRTTAFAHFGRPGLRMLGYDPQLDESWTGQKHLAGFYFDDAARQLSEEELMKDLPRWLSGHRDGVRFDQLFACLTNESPATSMMMKSVIGELVREKAIVVRAADGFTVRRRGVQKGTDVVRPATLRTVSFPGW